MVVFSSSAATPRAHRRRSAQQRRLQIELLEARCLLAAAWRNSALPEDVEYSGFISLADLLAVVDDLRTNGNPHLLPPAQPSVAPPPPYYNVDGLEPETTSAADLLQVLNPLREAIGLPTAVTLNAGLANDDGAESIVLTESEEFLVEAVSPVVLGQTQGPQTLRFTVDAQLDNTDTTAASDDLLLVYLVDPDDRGGPLASPVTVFAYDAAGNRVATTNARGHITTEEYDALNRVIRRIDSDPDGAGPLASPVTRFAPCARIPVLRWPSS